MKPNEYKARIEWVKTDKNGKQFTRVKIDTGEVFVHISKFQPKIYSFNIGDEIIFQIEDDIRGSSAKNIKIVSKEGKSTGLQSDKAATNITHASSSQRTPHGLTGVSPYDFCKRANKRIDNGNLKRQLKQLKQFHDRLNDGCYDLAFEIEWTTLTPTAANPCVDPESDPSPLGPDKEEYKGFDKRWLSVDKKLVISPFTVKSVIANGFANLMGSCYRVTEKEEGHKDDTTQGKYLYNGCYKRYRVAMDGSSKPGIIKKLAIEANGDRTITIQPVKEFYLDGNLKLSLKQGDIVYATLEEERGYRPTILGDISKVKTGQAIPLEYQGIYSHGMNGRFVQVKHKHRFIQPLKDKQGRDIEIEGTIKARDFLSVDSLKRVINMGNYRLKPDDPGTGEAWYDNLSNLTKNSFVYYEQFNGKISNIGKNFLFKALFLHEDAVPEVNNECKDVSSLCPRCALFGITDKIEDDENRPVGFKGRFKASALVCTESWDNEEKIPSTDPYPNVGNKPEITIWKKGDKIIAHQELLPILGPPKPNKRDIDGYFDKSTGEIRGAKIYRHGHLESANNIHGVNGENPDKYSHELRNYAHVCAPKLHFTGTVGVENSSVDEITALLTLLDTDYGKHGFKIGLGKAFGMGSMTSTVTKVWIRKPETYRWDPLKKGEGLWADCLKANIPGISDTLSILEKVNNKINSIKPIASTKLKKYPEPHNYWQKLRPDTV